MPLNHVLVTGANGFLGSAVVSLLANTALFVTATDRMERAKFSGIKYIPADILQPSSLSNVLNGIDCVCHIAGLAHVFDESKLLQESFHAVNTIGAINVAKFATRSGAKHFVFISSVSVYGGIAHDLSEDADCHPEGAYATSKWQAEQQLVEICQRTGMYLTILRLATLYGEEDRGNVARLIRAMDRGQFIWIGKGRNRKSLLYKEDAARACVTVMERPASGINTYNVSAPACTMREIVDGIADALGKHPFPLRVPASFALLLSRHLSRIPNRRMTGLHQTMKKWLTEDVYDTSRFKEAYGFQTETGLKDGLKREVDWYQRNN